MKRYMSRIWAFRLSLVLLLAGSVTVLASSGTADPSRDPVQAVSSFSNMMEVTLAAKTRMQTSPFFVEKGNTITVSVSASPSNAEIRYGILTPSGEVRFLTGSGQISHTFDVTENGSYRIFVENMSMYSVDITLFYMVNESK
ncbi:hypothetical protein MUB23_03745 [Cuneatibacter sp. NSJ-177]|uniref:hypothetical protein n=1 Tax=Cuneatibacter sp. NSJ-177 TaxID=2931401 RepID=UPI001FD2E63B|nr:hypothetical protein [Cuneatibacter sp. NSJ-177]MCJ7834511.1 hypothetical protein [Cuneatibacter sp. NSJ-177]